MIYDILQYGAVGDGTTNDGPAIQKAIDACAAAGGGRVLVPGGIFTNAVPFCCTAMWSCTWSTAPA